MSENIEQIDLNELIKNIVEELEEIDTVGKVLIYDGQSVDDFVNTNLTLNNKATIYIDLTNIQYVKSSVNIGMDATVFFKLYIVGKKDYTSDKRFENNSTLCIETSQKIIARLFENFLNSPLYNYPDFYNLTKFLSKTLNNKSVSAYSQDFSVFVSLFKMNKYQ